MGRQQGEISSAPNVSSLSESWARVYQHTLKSSEHLVGSLLEANRAIVATVGGSTRADTGEGRREAAIAELAYTEGDWSFDRSTDVREELGVGDGVTFTKRLTRTCDSSRGSAVTRTASISTTRLLNKRASRTASCTERSSLGW